MKVFEPLVLRIAVIVSVSLWALISFGFWLKGGGASPLHCLILLVMGLAAILPAGTSIAKKKWFPPVMSAWLLVMIPTALFAFNASAGLGNKCTHLFIPLGVFASASTLFAWAMTAIRDRCRARREVESRETRSATVAECPLIDSARQVS